MAVFKGIAQLWRTLPPAVQGGIALVGVGTGGWIGYKQVQKYQEKQRLRKAKKLFDASNKQVTVTDANGNAVMITINTAVTATKIHDAIYNNDWLGWTEDETAIVNALKVVPKPYMQDVEDKYMSLYGKNLQQDVVKALSSDEWDKVDYLFN